MLYWESNLKAGRRRMLCPDLPTARYLVVFARAGCKAAAIPYDITLISHDAGELASSWHRMLLLLDSVTAGRSKAFRARLRRLVIGKVRDEITDAGCDPRMPEVRHRAKETDRRQRGAGWTRQNNG